MATGKLAPWIPRREGTIPRQVLERHGSLIGQLIWARGWDEAEGASDDSQRARFEPRLDSMTSPFEILNMAEAADRVADAVVRGERIAVYADYDIDGMSGLAILVSFLEACGHREVVPYQPDRLAEGYGVHPAAIESLAEMGVKVVITVDTGISAFEAARVAQARGVDMIVTDHHQQIGELLPEGAIVVNPNQHLDRKHLSYLSGAGVAFYLAVALRSKLRERNHFGVHRPQPDLRESLDLFVLGTLADHVELRGDNRALVKAGLRQLLRTRRPGLEALRRRTITKGDEISARDVVFSLTPKLNAASRMGHAALSTELLLTHDSARAQVLVDEIMLLNQQRSEIQAQIFGEAVAQAESFEPDDPITLVYGNWHEGVLGIVASKLVEHFHRPAIVLTRLSHDEGILRGSMRTLPGTSCIHVLESCRELLRKFGGHEMAAGLQVESAKLPDLQTRLKSYQDVDAGGPEPQRIVYDGFLPPPQELVPTRIDTMNALGPWGSGNPEPLYLLEGIELTKTRVLKQHHIKIAGPDGYDIIGFYKAADIERFQQEGHQKIDALVRPETNRFRGTETVQLNLEHARPHQSHDPGFGS
jgi:single-stranded-DNA-specific exonuclease